MEDRAKSFELSLEQRDTAKLLSGLLGQAIAARYEDFCRLRVEASARSTWVDGFHWNLHLHQGEKRCVDSSEQLDRSVA
jgi:hypothetical protein